MKMHSPLAPSSASRRVNCPGSRALESNYPRESTSHSREGDAAHYVAAKLLRNETVVLDEQTDNGEFVNAEMLDHGLAYANYVRGVTKDAALFVERQISIQSIHVLCFGTPDCYAWAGGELHIFDYKYGHAFVDAYENWQLIEYAAGIIDHLKPEADPDDQSQDFAITLHIIQPRSYDRSGSFRDWRTSFSQLQPYFSRLREAENLAMSPSPPCVPSPECGYCAGRHACRALQRSVLHIENVVANNTPHELTPDAVGRELKTLNSLSELLKARITGLSEQALSLIKSGERVPFFQIEQSFGREKWAVSTSNLGAIAKTYNVNIFKPVEPITPKQAIKAGIPAEVVKMCSVTPRGGFKLVDQDLKISRKIFSKVIDKTRNIT